MHSSIYSGNVRHHRFHPTVNRFTYSIYLLLLDLDELDIAFQNNWFWSAKRFNLAWFRAGDHLRSLRENDQQTLKQLILDYLDQHEIVADGAIRLLTQVRHCGFAMNPASFFYCYNSAEKLVAVVTQVNNTPWGEEHLYLIEADGSSTKSLGVDGLPKQFHVSPFMPMEMHYDMRYTKPGDKLAVRMSNFCGDDRMLDVVMSLRKQKMTPMNLNWLLLLQPLMSFKVFAAIYWQAFKLAAKKVPFIPHPKKRATAESPHTDNPHPIQQPLN